MSESELVSKRRRNSLRNKRLRRITKRLEEMISFPKRTSSCEMWNHTVVSLQLIQGHTFKQCCFYCFYSSPDVSVSDDGLLKADTDSVCLRVSLRVVMVYVHANACACI